MRTRQFMFLVHLDEYMTKYAVLIQVKILQLIHLVKLNNQHRNILHHIHKIPLNHKLHYYYNCSFDHRFKQLLSNPPSFLLNDRLILLTLLNQLTIIMS